MGILSLFRKKKRKVKEPNTFEIETVEENHADCSQLLIKDSYISVKDKNNYILKNKLILSENDMEILNRSVDEHNQSFIEHHLTCDEDYLDNVLKGCDPNIKLDKEQRVAVLSDEDYTLIIAGAGAGKTTTVSAKVKYLVEKKNISPKDILVISFTNKTVNELKQRINKELNIDCPVTTFHATGNAIIAKNTNEKSNIVPEGKFFVLINDYFQREVLNNYETLNKIILFFSYYVDVDLDTSSPEALKKDLSLRHLNTLKSNIEEDNDKVIQGRLKNHKTINDEHVRSVEEVRIANFLYMNSIDYEYEEPYEYNIKKSNKIYLPDFTLRQGGKVLYYEHFGITESGKNSVYSEEQLKKYKEHIKDKIELHRIHNTKLIYTYSKYDDNKPLLEHLSQLLIDNGFELHPRSSEEVYVKLQKTEENRYFTRFIKLIMGFINNFKTNGFNESDFSRLRHISKNERNKAFLDIAEQVYLYYQNYLKQNNYVDFQDMINESSRILDEVADMKKKLNFKYIFVDEYQDISLQRFNLTKKLSEITYAKIIAVGDDWQSIYAFSGSKLELFTKFEESLSYAKILQITHTYRNSQELIDIAGRFVQENDAQIKKQLISPKSIRYPVAIFSYSDDTSRNTSKGKSGILEEKANALNKVLNVIVKRQAKPDSSILLIGRYGFDGNQLGRTSTFYIDERTKDLKSILYPDIKITFMTAHSSKGLGFDDVVIINGEDDIYGFPSQIQMDPVLKLVVSHDDSYEYAEERRLFYVALTRTKNRVYILSPKLHPSRFVVELLNQEMKNIYIDDKEISNVVSRRQSNFKTCPICGYPLFFQKNKYYGKNLWICSNDPEVCDFISNDLHGGITKIRKCPDCKNGILFIKKRKDSDSYFLGCSNYKSTWSGCNHAEPLDEVDKEEFVI